MAKKKGGGKEKKGKKEVKKKKAVKINELYKVNGESLERTNRTCPKCGSGVYMANHKDRSTCGKCGYMEKR